MFGAGNRISRVAVLAAISSFLASAAATAEEATPEFDLPEVVISNEPAAKPAKIKKAKKPVGSESAGPTAQPTAKKKPASTGSAEQYETLPAAAGGEGFAEGGASPPAESGVSFGRTQSSRIVEQVGTVNQVTAEQIERSGAKTLDQAIKTIPGIFVRNGGDGVPRIDIRGFRTRNIILLVDGVPQNATFDGQFDPRAIPTENIARVKVSLGGSSVLYGPGGNAAIIDIITKSATPGLHATSEASVGFGKSKDARATASYGSDTVKTFVSASIYDQDAYDLSDDFNFTKIQPTDRRVNSDREDRSFYANSEWTPSDTVSWGVSVSYRNGEYGKPPSTVNAFNSSGQCQNKPTLGDCSVFASGVRFERVDDYDQFSAQTSGLIKLGGGLSVRPTAYFNQLQELTNRFDDASFSTQKKNGAFSEDATTSIFGGGAQIAYRANDDYLTTLALDAHRETWDDNGFEIKQNKTNAIDTDEAFNIYSVALEHEAHLTSQLSAVLGAGWAEQDRSTTSDGDYTYTAGLKFAVTENTALRGSVARKIRFPTLRNLYGIGEGNPDLQTEVTENYEVGIDQNLPNINAFFTASVYRIDAQNFIEKDIATNLFRNDESLRFEGVETSFTILPVEGLAIQAGYTFLDATNEAAGPGETTAVQNEPRHKVLLSANYRFATGTSIWADYQYVTGSVAISRDNTATYELDPFHLLNLGITQDIPGEAGLMQIFGRIENVLDENYETSFGFPEPGRVFYIGLRTKL